MDAPSPRSTCYLHPGQLLVAHEDIYVTTLLGSCVSVFAWDQEAHVGGINHFLLPYAAIANGDDPLRYGDSATHALLAALVQAGASAARLRARVFGGACVLETMRKNRDHIGARNVEVAISILERAGIAVVEKRVGGEQPRKVVVRPYDGSAYVRLIG